MSTIMGGMAANGGASLPRVDILGVEVTMTDLPTAIEQIKRWIDAGRREYICVCDVNSLLHASKDPHLATLYQRSGMTLADGVPLVWAGRYAGFRDNQRVCGPDLMPAVMDYSLKTGWKHFLLGGAPGVADRLAEVLRQRHPEVAIVGTHCPSFGRAEQEQTNAMIEEVNSSDADIVWVGLGAPKQERWMGEYRSMLHAPVIVGVGAAFNFEVGDMPRAPRWMQRFGLEWTFRLFVEPKRLWRRYAVAVPEFLIGTLRHPPRAVRSSARSAQSK